MALLGGELRGGGALGIPRLQRGRAASLRQYVRSLALAANRRPMQRGAPFLIRPAQVAAREEQQTDGVGEPFVRGPVQRGPAVVVVPVDLRVPPHFEVVNHTCNER